MEDIIKIIKALGDETRIKILMILSKRRMCAKGLSRHLDVSEAAICQHIKVLKNANIIVGQKISYYVHYEIQEKRLNEVIDFIQCIKNKEEPCDHKYGIAIPINCKEICKMDAKKCCPKS
ncbi:ArsR family transcriptional regulator [Natranaerovirga hydrolytica]|uniref:ArsR family transcriptional regulator n=1 Tax=Natranaerovirga hydrolytica TaxID=680378 RepID=A0A4R1MZP4_9FIRM|nr:winged helix-turn-helix domain-containing protein [Natranaerovirga hydrolytica]TCK98817.1 ArsR family transcriptional regulator [Natranaerovirga hydrolytica]